MESTEISLSPRLQLCAAYVRPGTRLCDVGTDHAYLPIWLVQRGQVQTALACDVRFGPLKSAATNLAHFGLQQAVQLRQSDGLMAVQSNEADDIVIAGMGGDLIARIVQNAYWLRSPSKRLILQPMSKPEHLRRAMAANGFALRREEAVAEGSRIYTVLLYQYSPLECAVNIYSGALTGKNSVEQDYLQRQKQSLQKRLTGLLRRGETQETKLLCHEIQHLTNMQVTQKREIHTMTSGTIYDFIDSIAPFASAMDFDNPGLLVGSRDTAVDTVLFSLDITPAVAEEAHMLGAQLVVSHHPVIFNPLKRLQAKTAPYLLAQYGIDAICAHTNLDMAAGGVNTVLANRLGLQNVRTLSEYRPGLAQALMGDLPQKLLPADFAEQVKAQLGCEHLRYTDGKQRIQTVGLCSGGGADLLYAAVNAGCQGFVTGESKHNLLLDAEMRHLTLVDAGHFATEDIVIEPLMQRLQAQFPTLHCKKSQAMHSPARYL